MESGPPSDGRISPLTGPQSGVFPSTLGVATAAAGQPLTLRYLPAGDGTLVPVACEGTLTLRGRPAGSEPLSELLGPRAYSLTVLLSLERAAGVETSGVSWLFQTGEQFARAGGRLVLFAVPPAVLSLLELLQMDLPFGIAATEAEARTLALAASTTTS